MNSGVKEDTKLCDLMGYEVVNKVGMLKADIDYIGCCSSKL